MIQMTACLCRAGVLWSPIIVLNGANPLINQYYTAYNEPGAVVNGLPGAPLAISAGAYHSLALKTDGSVVGWGANDFGQANAPQNATNVVAISGGGYHSLALKADGSVVYWGNYNGGIGVAGDETDIKAIAAGYSFSLALRTNGTVVGWGEYYYGRSQPVTVPDSVTNVTAIAAGYAFSLVLKADGSVFGWGDDSEGQIDVPTSATNVIAIAAGAGHCMALKSDGTVVAWGNNYYGATNVPASATNVVAIAAGGIHCMALRADGTVVAWGWNGSGQTDVPSSATNIVAISAGYYNCLAKRRDGLVIGWGGNYYGQTSVPTDLSAVDLPLNISGSVNPYKPGTYKLIYTSTNNLGAIGSATRTVIVTDTTPPLLNITLDGGKNILTWPSTTVGYVLQHNPDLGTTNWSTNGLVVSDDGINKSVTNNPTAKCDFFRLVSQ